MKVTRNVFNIADLTEWLNNKELIINKDYQRGQGLWPINARSYFIDTILNGFPFPKVTLRQNIDLKTRKSVREIIDGQQRLSTIQDFVNNDLTLSSVSQYYRGLKFMELDDDVKEIFLSYEVSVDTIIAATDEEIWEVFRRMNSYTLPLNDQEKRHAIYQGEFKWFIKDMIDFYGLMFEKYKILTLRSISRMADADLMTELCQLLTTGIQSRSNSKLEEIYKKNDKVFKEKHNIKMKLKQTLDFIKVDLNPVISKEILKGYSLYSLFGALAYNAWGIPNVQPEMMDGLSPIGVFTNNLEGAIQTILELALAVDQRDTTGAFGEFVIASTATTHSINNRIIRMKWYVAALQNQI